MAGIDFRLYLITDRKLFGCDTAAMLSGIEEALKAGVHAVQLREKDLRTRPLLDLAYRMREMTARHGARLFVNDRVDIACAVDADGVHLGGTSIPVAAARKAGGSGMLVGVSTHSVDDAVGAETAGADFITFGPVFDTPSKRQYGPPVGLDLLRQAAAQVSLPVFAIGGITAETISAVRTAGAYGVALISGILAAASITDSTLRYVRELS